MECDAYRITCAISSLGERLSEPSLLDIGSLVVSGLAAVGTLVIAALNVRLLTSQSRREASQHDRIEKIPRRRLSRMLSEAVIKGLDRKSRSPLTPIVALAVNDEFAQLIDECNDPRAEELFHSCLQITGALGQRHSRKEQGAWVAPILELNGLIRRWVDEPEEAMTLVLEMVRSMQPNPEPEERV